MAPHIYLTGHIAIEHAGKLVTENLLPGRQGRLAFAYLVLTRGTPVTREDLVEVIWRDAAPVETEVALSAILSKLRGALRSAALTDAGIDVRIGSLVLRLPANTHIDVEDAVNAADEAEGAWRQRDAKRAWAHANVAVAIARRPLLRGEEAPWIHSERERLRALLGRSLQVLSAVSANNGETELALQYAHEVIDLEPFKETGYQQLMRLHAQLGNRGEALRVFARLRELMREELGASPSPQTEALFREILTA